MLAIRNVLEVRQGAGTFVTDKTIGIPDDPLGLTFIKDKHKLAFDLLELRIGIEPRFAILAAQNRTAEELEQLCLETEQHIRANEPYVDSDVAFHAKIADMSRNLIAPNLMTIIHQAILLFINVTERRLTEETLETHRLLVDSIRAKDTIAASDAMTLHLIYNRNEFRRTLQKSSDI